MASDQHRIEQIEHMIANGNADQVLLAHDICAKHRLKKWGGHGWDHIIARVVPRMRARGTSQSDIGHDAHRQPHQDVDIRRTADLKPDKSRWGTRRFMLQLC